MHSLIKININRNFVCLFLPFFVLMVLFPLSTALADQNKKKDKTNRKYLKKLSKELTIHHQKRKRTAIRMAKKYGWPIREEDSKGRIIEIQDVINNIPIYYSTENETAAKTSNVDDLYPGGSLGLNLTGGGITLGEWDGGKVRDTHIEFGGRVTFGDSYDTLSDHSTHVAGTMIAQGLIASAKGMSYLGSLLSHQWDNDDAEMATAAGDSNLLLSNHSYGTTIGWDYFSDFDTWLWRGDITLSLNEDYRFGFYDTFPMLWDEIAWNAPNYIIIKSAGNDRNDAPVNLGSDGHWYFSGGNLVYGTIQRDTDGGIDGYDCIAERSTAKNIITVGAVNDIVAGYSQPSDVVMTSFSSWGPTDDGRIKPDIVADGNLLYSTYSGSDFDYNWSSGTSMSAPVVTGTIGLLIQHYQNTHNNNNMRSATIKALIINAALESGTDTGPDYKFGWGLLDARGAALIISNDDGGTGQLIREETLNTNETDTFYYISNGTEPVKVTLCWTDTAPSNYHMIPALNDRTRMLVNDLDMRIQKGVSIYYSWVLDAENPAAAATTGDNDTDNVEQVYIESPAPAGYTILITHEGILTGGSQDYSLVVSGLYRDQTPPNNLLLTSPENGYNTTSATITFRWSDATDSSLPISYRLIVDTDFAGSYIVDITVSETFFTTTVPRDNILFWRVIASDAGGNTTQIGDSMLFVYKPLSVSIAGPTTSDTYDTRISPVDISGTTSGLFDGDTAFLYVGGAPTDTVNVFSDSFIFNNVTLTYFYDSYAVKVLNTFDTFAWDTLAITYDTLPPGTAALISPVNSETKTSSIINLDWSDVTDTHSGLAFYLVEVDSDINFGSPDFTGTVSDTSGTSIILGAVDTYYWRVTAYDLAGNTTVSQVDSFVLAVVDTEPPIVLSTAYSPVPVTNAAVNTTVFTVMASDSTGIDSVVIDLSSIGGNSAQKMYDNGSNGGDTTGGDSVYTFSILIDSSVAEGTYDLTVFLTDILGNTGVGGTISIFVHDVLPTYSPLISPSASSFSDGRIIVNGTNVSLYTSSSSGNFSYIVFEYRTSSPAGAWQTIGTDSTPLRWGIEWNTLTVAEDTYDVRAVGVDSNGNTDPSPGYITVIVDSSAYRIQEYPNSSTGKHIIRQSIPTSIPATITTIDGTQIDIPAGAINNTTFFKLERLTSSAVPSTPHLLQTFHNPGVAMNLTAEDGTTQFNDNIVIKIGYDDDNQDGLVDVTGIDETMLKMFYYDENTQTWVEIYGSTVNTDENYVQASVDHLTIFAVFGTSPVSDLSKLVIYPNPYRPNDRDDNTGKPYSFSDNQSGVIFSNVTDDLRIQVYTINGKRVSDFYVYNSNGNVRWDASNDNGRPVASGVYTVIITDNLGRQAVRQLMIIR